MRSNLRRESGVSLTELLVAAVVLSVVLGAVFLRVKQARLEVGQKARLAAERIRRELLSAGYNTPADVMSISEAEASSVTFSVDTDDDGTAERVTFSPSGTNIVRTSQLLDANGNPSGSPTSQAVASNISALVFTYLISGIVPGSFVRDTRSPWQDGMESLLRCWGFVALAQSNSNSNANSSGSGQSSVASGDRGQIIRINFGVNSFASENNPFSGEPISVALNSDVTLRRDSVMGFLSVPGGGNANTNTNANRNSG